MLAVDIVLIAPRAVREKAIQLNRSLTSSAESDFALDHQTCIPHISLLIGVVPEKQLGKLQLELERLAKKTAAIELTIPAYAVSTLPNKKYVSSLIIAKDSKLQRLHETLLKKTGPILKNTKVSKEMFFQGTSSIPEFSVSWVKRFILDSSKINYQPHITLGLGQVQSVALPIIFKASELALCQLGNYCTCRKVLWSKKLTS